MRYARCARRQVLHVLAISTVLISWAAVRAHETDQYTMPVGREFADLKHWLSEFIYDALDRAVEKTNLRIERSLRNGTPTSRTHQWQSPRAIATAFKQEFPPFLYFTEVLERKLRSEELRIRYPGLLAAHRPPRWIYHHPLLVIDPLRIPRLMRCSTIMADGTYFGTDKILHFIHVGYLFFEAYWNAIEEGQTPEEALRRAVNLGAGDHPLSERRALGYIATGVISNGDLAADYAGLKFYRNLTQPVRIGDRVLPPLLVRQGPYFAFNDHVRRGSDFFKLYISDHWNEALNPSTYAPGVDRFVRAEIQDRCPTVLAWYRDEHGQPFSQDRFERIANELTTWHGESYGHQGELAEMITIANVCFEGAIPQSPAAVQSARGRKTPQWRLAAD